MNPEQVEVQPINIDPLERLTDRELLIYNARALTAIHNLLAQGVTSMVPLLGNKRIVGALKLMQSMFPNA